MTDVIVNFMYQLDWDKQCPDIWLNMISGCACDDIAE
jgi:hypothetical protein